MKIKYVAKYLTLTKLNALAELGAWKRRTAREYHAELPFPLPFKYSKLSAAPSWHVQARVLTFLFSTIGNYLFQAGFVWGFVDDL